jgi:hypothetical protein
MAFSVSKPLGYQPETPSPVEGTPPRLQLGWGFRQAARLSDVKAMVLEMSKINQRAAF